MWEHIELISSTHTSIMFNVSVFTFFYVEYMSSVEVSFDSWLMGFGGVLQMFWCDLKLFFNIFLSTNLGYLYLSNWVRNLSHIDVLLLKHEQENFWFFWVGIGAPRHLVRQRKCFVVYPLRCWTTECAPTCLL